MKSILIRNCRILKGEKTIHDHSVLIEGKFIKAIIPDHTNHQISSDLIIDAKQNIVSPGFIDVHTHGGIGIDFMEASEDEIISVLNWMAGNGVIGVLPTIASTTIDSQLRMIEVIKKVSKQDYKGARILGIHLEGPYISKEKRGAQLLETIRDPDIAEFQQLVDMGAGLIKLVTIAPELPGAIELIRTFSDQGIIFGAGHTTANYDQILTAFEAGLDHMIHLFNAMPALNHRDPGPVGAALGQDNIFSEIILDGHHVHPEVVRIVLRAKGYKDVLLITDSTQATGMEDGVFIRPGNRKIFVNAGVARLENGNLAGSTITMPQAVSNAIILLNLQIEDAIRMASQIPAQSIRLDSQYGTLEPGKRADLIILDENIDILLTMVDGNIVFSKKGNSIL